MGGTGPGDYTGWTDEQWRTVTAATVGRPMGKAEGEAWIARFYQEHGAFPWQTGPFDAVNNMIDHLIALGESLVEAEGGYYSNQRYYGNRYADQGVVPEFWEQAYYRRYPGPMYTPSGAYAGYQSYLVPGQMPPPYAPWAYLAGVYQQGQPYEVARPLYYYQPRMRPEYWPPPAPAGDKGPVLWAMMPGLPQRWWD